MYIVRSFLYGLARTWRKCAVEVEESERASADEEATNV